MTQTVRISRRGAFMVITLDRPPVNAIDRATSLSLYEAFQELEEDPTAAVGVLTAAGEKVFSAGWDLKEYAADGDAFSPDDVGPGGLGGLPANWSLRKPVIAAVQGRAIGGAFEMLLAADLILAAPEASFSLPELRVGFLPDGGGIQRLWRRLPYHVASDLVLTGRPMPADEALRWGLVKEVVERPLLLARAEALAEQLSEVPVPVLRALKEVMQKTEALSPQQAFDLTGRAWNRTGEMPAYEALLHSGSAIEGAQRFADGRKGKPS